MAPGGEHPQRAEVGDRLREGAGAEGRGEAAASRSESLGLDAKPPPREGVALEAEGRGVLLAQDGLEVGGRAPARAKAAAAKTFRKPCIVARGLPGS